MMLLSTAFIATSALSLHGTSALHGPVLKHYQRKRASASMITDEKANAMFDTLDASARPELLSTLEPHDKLTAAFLGHGVVVSGLNIVGFYGGYEYIAVGVAALIGLTSACWGWADLALGQIADDDRPGFAHERAIMLYTTSYLAGVMWLSLRFSPLYPPALTPLDSLPLLASMACYVYGLVSPIYTMLFLHDALTPTERLRMKGMVVSGLVGSVFLLESVALLVNGPDWWTHVMALYPAQSVLEPSVTLFAAYAVEAGVLIHRLARRGVITFEAAVPFYGKLVLPLLTLLPMASLFWYKQNEVSTWKNSPSPRPPPRQPPTPFASLLLRFAGLILGLPLPGELIAGFVKIVRPPSEKTGDEALAQSTGEANSPHLRAAAAPRRAPPPRAQLRAIFPRQGRYLRHGPNLLPDLPRL